jgi:hypothetical protein
MSDSIAEINFQSLLSQARTNFNITSYYSDWHGSSSDRYREFRYFLAVFHKGIDYFLNGGVFDKKLWLMGISAFHYSKGHNLSFDPSLPVVVHFNLGGKPLCHSRTTLVSFSKDSQGSYCQNCLSALLHNFPDLFKLFNTDFLLVFILKKYVSSRKIDPFILFLLTRFAKGKSISEFVFRVTPFNHFYSIPSFQVIL